jgi:arylsulfatase
LPPLFVGFTITAEVTVPPGGAEGVLFALGDWNGGFALIVVDGRLVFAFSRAGELLEVVAEEPVPSGAQVLGVTSVPSGAGGSFTLLHGDRPVGRLEYAGPLPLALQHGGAGLRIGHDAGLPVTDRYTPPFPWTGDLRVVVFAMPGASLANIEEEIRVALHSD